MNFRLILLFICTLISSNAVSYNVNIYESEPNDTKDNATFLPYNYTIKKGNINSLVDSDWYKLHIDNASSLTIKFDHPEDNYVYNIFLIKVYNSTDDLLSQRYIYAPDATVTYEVGLGGAGDYYVVVETACEDDLGRCEYHRSDEYSLVVSVFNTDDYFLETEPNNTVETADKYLDGGIITGQIATKSDADYFVINTNGAADINVGFYHIGDNYQYNLFYVEILDSNDVVLNSTSIYAPDDLTNLGFSVATAGNYYIKVTGCQGDGRCDTHGTDQYTIKTLISPLDSDECIEQNKVIIIPFPSR